MKINNANPVKSFVPSFFSDLLWESGESFSYQLKAVIHQAISELFADDNLKILDIHLEHPKEDRYGDYSSNIAMTLSKSLRQKPFDIANLVKNKIDEYIRSNQKISYKTDSNPSKAYEIRPVDILEKIAVAGPGFLNLTIRTPYLITLIHRLLENRNGVRSSYSETGKPDAPLAKKTIMVEFAHPNTHKAFHIGHIRNIATGETIVRILEESGAKIIRANYQGDVGLHIAKTLYALIFLSPYKEEVEKVEGVKNRAEFLGKAYAGGSAVYEENSIESDRIKDINFLIYECAQRFSQKEGVKPGSTDYSQFVHGRSVDVGVVQKLWEKTRKWSLDYFEGIYKRVYTHYDRYFFESECLGGVDIAKELVKKKILSKNEGAVIFDGKTYGLDTRVFVNSLGLPTYEAKELSLAQKEFSEFGDLDQCIHVVGPEQASFFQVTFKVEELLDKEKFQGRQFHHIYGWVRLKKGKMSSRLGNVVLGEWLLDEAKLRILKILNQSNMKYNKEDQDTIAEKVAVAAVKYSMLKVSSRMDIAFDISESVSLEGDSGPYLLYTYARCESVLRKASQGSTSEVARRDSSDGGGIGEFNSEETSLLRSLIRFPEVVTEAARTLSPNIICTYLFDLAQKYNLFYNKHSILNLKTQNSRFDREARRANLKSTSATAFRLFLTEATSTILNRGLYLLGIETVERM